MSRWGGDIKMDVIGILEDDVDVVRVWKSCFYNAALATEICQQWEFINPNYFLSTFTNIFI